MTPSSILNRQAPLLPCVSDVEVEILQSFSQGERVQGPFRVQGGFWVWGLVLRVFGSNLLKLEG